MALGISTSWNAWRHKRAEPIIAEIRDLGFSDIELSFNLTAGILRGIEAAFKGGLIRVSSVHNFCPIPAGVKRTQALPDYYSLASKEESQRRAAIEQTKKTIDTAARLSARAVVIHSGRLEIKDRTRELIALRRQGLQASAQYRRLKKEAIAERRKHAAAFFECALKSLDQLNRYAAKAGVALGIENRFYYREIPSQPEIGIILKKFRGGSIFYWHDTGHAQVREELGLENHREYLENYSSQMLGIHLHDVMNCQDHLPASKGNLDFRILRPYLKKGVIAVNEAHHPARAQAIKASKAYLEEVFVGLI